MKLKTFVNESSYNDPYVIVSEVYHRSLPFIMELTRHMHITMASRMLLSGRHDDSPMIIKEIRTDRSPKDTPSNVHYAADAAFHKVFGLKTRSSSVFLTSKYGTAGGYGSKIYAIFPTGTNWEIVWSSTISDLWSDVLEDREFMNLGSEVDDVVQNLYYDDHFNEEVDNTLYRSFEDENSEDDFLDEDGNFDDDAYREAREVYIDDNHKSMFEEMARRRAEDMLETLEDDFERTIKAKYQKGNLKGAIESGNEVMLTGDSYVGIRIEYLPYLLAYIETNGTKKPTPELFANAIRDIDWNKFLYAHKVDAKSRMRNINKDILSLINIDDLKKPE